MGRSSLSRTAPLIVLLLLPLLVFHRPLLLGEAFLPADLLAHLYPYKGVGATAASPWNVLRFDGITQFYPWRLSVARTFAEGHIPLWNPYAFAAAGGTPLLANSQSAPLYPLNALFALFYRVPGAFPYAFGLVAALHLLIAVKGVYNLCRALSLLRPAALLGAVTFGLSAPVITWLALPTFLAVACWIPWLLLLIHLAHKKAGTRTGNLAIVGTGLVGGLMLLAGHLQIALYGLLAAGLYALWKGAQGIRSGSVAPVRWLFAAAGATLLALLLAFPQVLPAVELSRVSSRASARPTWGTYQAYIANALPIRNLTTALVPDFFGHPNRDSGFYWNTNNYAEWAFYVGVLPLCLAVVALALPWRRETSLPPDRGFFAGLFALALLMALGTPVNLPLFFLVPGYSQTGNPGRCLILFALAASMLAAIGLHALLSSAIDTPVKRRAVAIGIAIPTLVAALGLSAAARFAATLPGVTFGPLLAHALPDLGKAVVLLLLSAVGLAAVASLNAERRALAAPILIVLTIVDLATWGYSYNPTTTFAAVYPVTPGIAFLQANARDALIAPLNRGWSNGAKPPRAAILPPNALTVYGLHDIGGYDSLFPNASKEQVQAAGDGEDPSPPENGNIVLVKSVEVALSLGARYILAPPEAPDLSPAGITPVYTGPDMVVYENPAGHGFDPSAGDAYRPASFRLGLFLGLTAVGAITLLVVALALKRRDSP